MKNIVFFLLAFTGFFLFSQQKEMDSIPDDYILIEGDSIEFSLDEIVLSKKIKFDNIKEKRYYFWYWKKVHKAYPYALLTSKKLKKIDTDLARIKSKRKRKRHIKKAQKILNEEFKGKLKKLTRTEGKLLIRLVHRQTGSSVFTLIKKYRSGWKAFWYNSTAKLFKMSLKTEYHPESRKLDFMVEDILQRAFSRNSLTEEKSALDFNYEKLSNKYKNIDIVKEIENR